MNKSKDTVKRRKCKLCDYSTNHKSTLDRHINTHTRKNTFRCKLCDFTTIHKYAFQNHLKSRHEPKGGYKCQLCNFQTNKQSKLQQHSIAVHNVEELTKEPVEVQKELIPNGEVISYNNTKIYKCAFCDYTTRFKGRFNSHTNVHTKLNEFKCHLCSFVTIHKSYLNKHINSIHTTPNICECEHDTTNLEKKHVEITESKKKKLKCTFCDYITNVEWRFKRHANIHVTSNEFKCHLCTFVTIDDLILKCHIKSTHQTKKLPGKYKKCEYCNFSTNRLSVLKRHTNTHTMEQIYKCDFCDHTSLHKYALRTHVNSAHTQTETFHCHVCNFEANQKSAVIQHVKTNHQNETAINDVSKSVHDDKKFKCAYCNFTTNYKWQLNVHTNTHTKERTFNCSICDFVTVLKSNLKRHVDALHGGSDDFGCPYCKYKTSMQQYLNEHIIRMHNSEDHSKYLIYQCTLCDYKSSLKKDLKLHKLTHVQHKRATNAAESITKNVKMEEIIEIGPVELQCQVKSETIALKQELI